MKVGIVGLGLIGGSFAKAYSQAGHTVLAADTDDTVLGFAELCGAVAGRLTEDNMSECDLILICVYPDAAIDFLEKENMERLIILNMKPTIPKRNICILKRKDTSLSIAASELEKLIQKDNGVNNREQVQR